MELFRFSTGGGKFNSGQGVNDMALGAISLAQHIHLVAERYDVLIALHTDHCHPQYVDSFMIPLIEETEKRRAQGLPNLFNSHMFDGSELPLEENIAISKSFMKDVQRIKLFLKLKQVLLVARKTVSTMKICQRISSIQLQKKWLK